MALSFYVNFTSFWSTFRFSWPYRAVFRVEIKSKNVFEAYSFIYENKFSLDVVAVELQN